MDDDNESTGDVTGQLFNLVLENRMFKNILMGYCVINGLIVILLISILVIHLKNIHF